MTSEDFGTGFDDLAGDRFDWSLTGAEIEAQTAAYFAESGDPLVLLDDLSDEAFNALMAARRARN